MLHDSVELGSVDIPENGELRLELPAYLVVKLFRGTAELRPIVYPCTSNAHCSGSIYEIKRIEIVSSPQERRSVRTLA